MEYATPEVEVLGAGSQLVQAFYGPNTDYGAHSLSFHQISGSNLEEA